MLWIVSLKPGSGQNLIYLWFCFTVSICTFLTLAHALPSVPFFRSPSNTKWRVLWTVNRTLRVIWWRMPWYDLHGWLGVKDEEWTKRENVQRQRKAFSLHCKDWPLIHSLSDTDSPMGVSRSVQGSWNTGATEHKISVKLLMNLPFCHCRDPQRRKDWSKASIVILYLSQQSGKGSNFAMRK